MGARDRFKKRLALSTARSALQEEQAGFTQASNFAPVLLPPAAPDIWDGYLNAEANNHEEANAILVQIRSGLDE